MTGESISLGSQDPRGRRDLQEEQRLEFPLRRTRDGRTGVQVDPKSAVAVDPARGLGVRAGPGLVVASASPFALQAALGDGMAFDKRGKITPRLGASVKVIANRLEARPTAAQVTETTDGDTQTAINRLGAALASLQTVIGEMSPAALAFLAETSVAAMRSHLEAPWEDDSRLPLYRGRADLVGGTASVSDTDITTAYTVLISRQIAGGAPGNLTVAITNGVGFDINSDDPLDTSNVAYGVWQ